MAAPASATPAADSSKPIYQFQAKAIDNKTEVPLTTYAGKVLLIVNTASKCGFTVQYDGLEVLYKKYKDRGLVILGFPCDQFGHQEPGKEEEIEEFCRKNHGVTFPLFAKIDVNGDNAHPLFKYLKHEKSGLFGTEFIKWNFSKFLVDRNGNVVERFSPNDTPDSIDKHIAKLL